MISDLIYDIGMHNGNDTAYYLHKGYRVVAIEADPTWVVKTRQRFAAEIAARHLTILNVGIAQKSGPQTFWISDSHSEFNSFNRELAARDGLPHHAIEVECLTFDSILADYGVPYYLKVDIEGHDHLCIQALSPNDLPRYISAESGGLPLLNQLHAVGYDSFKCLSQFNFLPVELPPTLPQRYYQSLQQLWQSHHPVARFIKRVVGWQWVTHQLKRYRQRADWHFAEGSAGPFGEETPGRWHSFAEMQPAYLHFAALSRNQVRSGLWDDTTFSFWADFHARRL